MKEMVHPGNFIPAGLTNSIRSFASEAERSGQLLPEQLEIIYDQHWFNLFVPKSLGGLELDLPQALRTEEALAWIDGSIGWTITLCAGANSFIGFLKPAAVKEIFNNPKVCLAGSGKSTGIATITNDGYEVTGYWKYATGAPYATVFTCNCQLEKDGVLLKDDAGNVLTSSFWFHREEVIIHPDWNMMGMIATASHSFEVKKLRIPADRDFIIDSKHAFLHHPIYQFPFLQFAEATLAVNSSGIAISFLDVCENDKAKEAATKLNAARETFYRVIELSWKELLSGASIQPGSLDELSRLSRDLARIARETVDEVYPYCGLIAADRNSDINRAWRDLHTASQHSLLR